MIDWFLLAWILLFVLHLPVHMYLKQSAPPDPFNKQLAQLFFYPELLLYSIWPLIFYGFQQPKVALMEIVLLLIFIVFAIVTVYRVAPKGSLLLLPHLTWALLTVFANLIIAHSR